MKTMFLTMLVALAIAAPLRAQDAPADSADWEQAVRAAEERHVAAGLTNDAAEWDSWLSDEFVVNSPLNTIVEKPALLDFIRRGILSVASFEQEIELVRRFGDIVVVMGEDAVVWAPPSPHAGRTDRRRFTDLWRMEQGVWRLFARQATLLPSASNHEGAP